MAIEDARREVHPALIYEAHVLHVDLALAIDPLLPEVQESLRSRAHRDEAEIVDAGSEDGCLVNALAISGDRRGDTGSEHNPVLAGEHRHLVERSIHPDVRIQVDRGIGITAR